MLKLYINNYKNNIIKTLFDKIKQKITVNLKLNLNNIWTIVNNENQELITNIQNNNWLFIKKQDNMNIYILNNKVKVVGDIALIDFKEGRIKNYEDCFILSAKVVKKDLNTEILKQYLVKSNLNEVSSPNRKPLFLYMETLDNKLLDKRYYNTECYIMNILSKGHKIITNKYWLYLNFNKKYPDICKKYMASTVDLLKFDKNLIVGNKKIFISRPVGVGAFSGKDIVIISDNTSLAKALLNIPKYENVIVSEYIINPYLYQSKKTHYRYYLLVSIISGIYSTYLLEFFEQFHAKLPYIKGEWDNKDIHDTHYGSTEDDIIGPDDFEPEKQKIFNNTVWSKVSDCLFHVSKILEGNATPYDNSKNAFEIFGCDILVHDDYEITLMEINEHTGYGIDDKLKNEEFSQKIFERINNIIINPAINGIPSTVKPLYTKNMLNS